MAESSHQKALNIAQKITEIGKQRQDQLKEEGFLTGIILNRTRDLATAKEVFLDLYLWPKSLMI